jgi:hypothetical protein
VIRPGLSLDIFSNVVEFSRENGDIKSKIKAGFNY